MLTKFASFGIIDKFEIPSQTSRSVLRRMAHRVEFDYEPRPGFLYVRSRAISSRCNDNFDEFPAAEIKVSYRTFVGKPVFVNHHNDNHRRARGVIIDAKLHEDRAPDGSPDTWCEVLMEVDAVRFPKLAKAILAGHIDRTSMGTDVAFSKCSFCGNKATTPLEYCTHIPALKGKRIVRTTASGKKEGILVREICYGLKFFENSLLVEEPADPTAYFLGVEAGPGVVGPTAVKVATRTASWVGEPCQECGGEKEDRLDGGYTPICRNCWEQEAYQHGVKMGTQGGDSDVSWASPGVREHVLRGIEDGKRLSENPTGPSKYSSLDAVQDQLAHLNLAQAIINANAKIAELSPISDCKSCGAKKGTHCDEGCDGVRLYRGDKTPTMKASLTAEAISDADLDDLTDLPKVDLPSRNRAHCKRCGAPLANSLESSVGLCPACEDSGGRRQPQRSRQKTVRTMDGRTERTALMMFGSLLKQAVNTGSDPFEYLKNKWESYQGRKNHVPLPSPNTHLWKDEAGNFHVKYYNTNIVSYSPEGRYVTYRHNGWTTSNTTQRMNSYGHPNHSVTLSQKAYHTEDVPEGRQRTNVGPRVFTGIGRGSWGPAQYFNGKPHVTIDTHAGHESVDDHVPDNLDPVNPPRRRRGQDRDTGYPSGQLEEGPRTRSEPSYPTHDATTPAERPTPDRGSHVRDDMNGNNWNVSHDDMPQDGEDFYSWVNRTAPKPKFDNCDRCNGRGKIGPFGNRQDCPRCQGTGYLDNEGKPHDPGQQDTRPAHSDVDMRSPENPERRGGHDPVLEHALGPSPQHYPMRGQVDGDGIGEGRATTLLHLEDHHGRDMSSREDLPDSMINDHHDMLHENARNDGWEHGTMPHAHMNADFHDGRWGNNSGRAVPLSTVNTERQPEPALDQLGRDHLHAYHNVSDAHDDNLYNSIGATADELHRSMHANAEDAHTEGWTPHQHSDDGIGDPNAYDVNSPTRRTSMKHTAYGEMMAPRDVDTLRDEECPVCAEKDSYDGDQCQVCGFVKPPSMFMDPNLEMAKQVDLRKDNAPQGATSPLGDPLTPGGNQANPMDPNAVDAQGMPNEVPGSGTPGSDTVPLDPANLDPNGQPIQPGNPLMPGQLPMTAPVPGQNSQTQKVGPDGQPLIDPDTGLPMTGVPGPAQPGMQTGMPMEQPGQQTDIYGQPLGPLGPIKPGQGQVPVDPATGLPVDPVTGQPTGMEPLPPEQVEQMQSQQDQLAQQANPGQVPGAGMAPDGQTINPELAEDNVVNLVCPMCGFTTVAAPPMSTTEPMGQPTGDVADGAQEGDMCPNCGKALLMAEDDGADEMFGKEHGMLPQDEAEGDTPEAGGDFNGEEEPGQGAPDKDADGIADQDEGEDDDPNGKKPFPPKK